MSHVHEPAVVTNIFADLENSGLPLQKPPHENIREKPIFPIPGSPRIGMAFSLLGIYFRRMSSGFSELEEGYRTFPDRPYGRLAHSLRMAAVESREYCHLLTALPRSSYRHYLYVGSYSCPTKDDESRKKWCRLCTPPAPIIVREET